MIYYILFIDANQENCFSKIIDFHLFIREDSYEIIRAIDPGSHSDGSPDLQADSSPPEPLGEPLGWF